MFVKAIREYEGIVGVFDQHSNRSGAMVRRLAWRVGPTCCTNKIKFQLQQPKRVPLILEVRNRVSLYISKSSILCSITKLWIEFQTQLWPAWTVLILGVQQCIIGVLFRSLKLTNA